MLTPLVGDVGEQLTQRTGGVRDLDHDRDHLVGALAPLAGQRPHTFVAAGEQVDHDSWIIQRLDQMVQIVAHRDQLFADRGGVGRHDLTPHPDVGGCDPGDVSHPLPGQPQVASRYLSQPGGGQAAHQLRKVADFGDRAVVLVGVHLTDAGPGRCAPAWRARSTAQSGFSGRALITQVRSTNSSGAAVNGPD